MNMLAILLKREFWEHRKTFFYLPLIILALLTKRLESFLINRERVLIISG